ncbi:MAG: tetratricopeptide repeat protein [Candidatus Eremiobacterota bacterium]
MHVRNRFLAILCFGCLTLGSPAWAQDTPQESPSPAPAATESASAQAREELRKGVELARRGYTESAIVSLRKAIELDPELVEAYVELGKILLETRNTAFAITIYSKLAELEPQKAEWKEILMELQVTYDQPRAAAMTGEELLKLKPDDTELMVKLIDLYHKNGLALEEAMMWDRLGKTRATDAKPYFEAGKLYMTLGMRDDAVRTLERAVTLDPKTLDYGVKLSEAYTEEGQFDKAETLLNRLMTEHPDAPGLKDKLAEVHVGKGDRSLERERYMGARDDYRRAKELAIAGGSLQQSLDERIATAENRYGPFVDNWVEWSRFNIGGIPNDATLVTTRVSVPIAEQDLYIQGWHQYRTLSAPGVGSASLNLGRLGFEWRPDPYLTAQAWGGTEGLFRAGARYDGDRVQGGFYLLRDINYDTPLALASKLKYFGQTGFVDVEVLDWLSLGGDFLHAAYDDGSDQWVYNIGPFFTLMQEEGVYEWGVGYTHGANTNSPPQNPFLRFGPANLQIDTVGTRFRHTPTENWGYYLGYYRNFFNDGTPSGNTFEVGTDIKFNETSFLRLDYQNGATPLGNVPTTGGSASNNNQSLRSQIHITF